MKVLGASQAWLMLNTILNIKLQSNIGHFEFFVMMIGQNRSQRHWLLFTLSCAVDCQGQVHLFFTPCFLLSLFISVLKCCYFTLTYAMFVTADTVRLRSQMKVSALVCSIGGLLVVILILMVWPVFYSCLLLNWSGLLRKNNPLQSKITNWSD